MTLADTKARRFAKEYLKNGMNAKAALRAIEPKYRDLSNLKQQRVAEVKASRLLSNDKVKMSMAEIMDENGLSDADIEKLLKRNAKQSKNIPASNQALDMSLKIKGHYAPEKKLSLNVDIQGSIDEEITDLMTQIQELQKLTPPK